MDEHILFAYEFDNQGNGFALTGNNISKQIKEDTLAWVHLDANHPDTRQWLEREVSYLSSLVLDALLVDETRPRMTQINDGVLLLLRGVNLNINASPEDMISIRLWVDKQRIISIQKRPLKAVKDIEEQINTNKAPKDSADFIVMLVARLFKRMENTLTSLNDKIDDVEEGVIDAAGFESHAHIVNIRKQAIIFKRYMSPQREAIGSLLSSNLKWLTESHKSQLRESYNDVTRYIEDLDAVRERAQVIKDEWANIMANKLNNNMYVLSVIAAIFLPVSFLTGLLGVNIGGIPGVDNSEAFIIFCGILTIIAVLQVVLFKKMKWF